MKLWHLHLNDGSGSAVVRAETEAKARTLASCAGSEASLFDWMNPTRSSCSELTVEGDAAVVVLDRGGASIDGLLEEAVKVVSSYPEPIR